MKKLYYLISALAITGSMASCSENDTPEITAVETLSGLYIVNNGNMGSNIPSSITAYDYSSEKSTPALQDAFMSANGIALGDGAQAGLIYGTKMYIPMQTSNLVWVVDAETLKIIDSVRPEGNANGPRALTASNGKVFASMVSGYVCAIDTITLKIEKTLATGPNPEQMAVAGGKLYVTNSDGYNWDNGYINGSISIIDLATYSETKIKDISKVLNPTDMATNGKDVFVICKGNYGDVPSMVKKIEGTEVKDVTPGNYMAIREDKLYVINAPIYGGRADMTFDVFNTETLKKVGEIANQKEGTDSWIDYPAGIGVDPVNGDIVLLSYTLTEAGYTQYSSPAYVNIYESNGDFKKRFDCGVGPVGVCFVHTLTLK